MKKINNEFLNKIGLKKEGATLDLLFDFMLCFERVGSKLYIIGEYEEDRIEIEFQENAEAIIKSFTDIKK